jgi:hypothetical protein
MKRMQAPKVKDSFGENRWHCMPLPLQKQQQTQVLLLSAMHHAAC